MKLQKKNKRSVKCSRTDLKVTTDLDEGIPAEVADDVTPKAEDDITAPSEGDEEESTENYGLLKIQTEMEACLNNSQRKPHLSYIALIGLAILNSENHQMLLADIYDWISENFPYFHPQDRSWRNSVRHNLSLNECFVKSEKNKGGKGSHWMIHDANQQDFTAGDFRRRHARRTVRHWDATAESQHTDSKQDQSGGDCYVPMTSVMTNVEELIATYGREAILGNDEKLQLLNEGAKYNANFANTEKYSNDTALQPSEEYSNNTALHPSEEYSNNTTLHPSQTNQLDSDERNNKFTVDFNNTDVGHNNTQEFGIQAPDLFNDEMAFESGLKILTDALNIDNSSLVQPEFMNISIAFPEDDSEQYIGCCIPGVLAVNP